MKKILLLALAIFATTLQSQILNPGFESVTAGKPNNWNTVLYHYNSYYIKDTSDAHTGSHAAYIKGFAGLSYTVQGAALGIFSTTGLPSNVQCWFKCNLMPGDSLVLNPFVYYTTATSPRVLSYSYTTTSTSVYKQLTASFNYSAFGYPSVDTLFIDAYLSGPNVDAQGVFIPQAGSWAIIDDMTIGPDIATGIKETVIEDGIEKVYPQPASNMAFMIYNLTETSECELKLTDITGKEIKTIFDIDKQTSGKYKAEIPVYDLAPGVYLAQLKVNGQIRTAKVIKQ